MIHETLGENVQGFVILQERIQRICENLGDFGRGFARICKTLGEYL